MEEIERLRERLDALRPLRKDGMSSLIHILNAQTANYVQASNAIEGNTLSVGETLVIITEDRVIPNKSMSEHTQAANGARAFKIMLEMASGRTTMTVNRIIELHAAVEAGRNHAGRYRDHPVYVGGSMHVPPNHVKVPRLMGEALERFAVSLQEEHPIIAAAKLHFDLVSIHPFADGNGRTSGLAQNHLSLTGILRYS